MYNNYFGFRENPFSIAPDPRYFFLSGMHQDALKHLRFGAASNGGIILLTGDAGTGKTTLCRYFLEQIGPTAEIALITDPALSTPELLTIICDQFRAPVDRRFSMQDCIDALNGVLLAARDNNRETLLIIDEAQNLDKDALEIIRLLTNLETDQHKLLKIFLLGQPELAAVLKGPDLAGVAQHITGRFHVGGLEKTETGDYIRHRLSVAGGPSDNLFSAQAIKRIHRLTGGIPRQINTLCDRSLIGAFSESKERIDDAVVKKAARDIFGFDRIAKTIQVPVAGLVASVAALLLILTIWVGSTSDQFYLNLDSILDRPSTQKADTAAKEPSTEPSERLLPENAVRSDGAAADHQPAPIKSQAAPQFPQVDHIQETTAEAFSSGPRRTQPKKSSDDNTTPDAGLNNIFIAPLQISPEPEEEPNTRIVIKHIEIN